MKFVLENTYLELRMLVASFEIFSCGLSEDSNFIVFSWNRDIIRNLFNLHSQERTWGWGIVSLFHINAVKTFSLYFKIFPL